MRAPPQRQGHLRARYRRPAGPGLARAEALRLAEESGARLAQAGRTNREIAGQLYLTVNTVETHLRHVYAKLGISRRTQLASRSDALTP